MHDSGINEDDVEFVLRTHSARVVSTDGKSLGYFAYEIFGAIDGPAVERAALTGGIRKRERVVAAYYEIEQQLIRLGVLVDQHLSSTPTLVMRKTYS